MQGEWAEFHDEANDRHYYHNSLTGATQWTPPDGWGGAEPEEPEAPEPPTEKPQQCEVADEDSSDDETQYNPGEKVRILIDRAKDEKAFIVKYIPRKNKWGVRLENGTKMALYSGSIEPWDGDIDLDLTEAVEKEPVEDFTKGQSNPDGDKPWETEYERRRKRDMMSSNKHQLYGHNREVQRKEFDPSKAPQFDPAEFDQLKTGIVRSWVDERGFGFIRPDSGRDEKGNQLRYGDVFFHIRQCMNEDDRPEKGMRVCFRLQMGKLDKPEAHDVDREIVLTPEQKVKQKKEDLKKKMEDERTYALGQPVQVAVELGQYETVKVTKCNADGSYAITFPPSKGSAVWDNVRREELREATTEAIGLAKTKAPKINIMKRPGGANMFTGQPPPPAGGIGMPSPGPGIGMPMPGAAPVGMGMPMPPTDVNAKPYVPPSMRQR